VVKIAAALAWYDEPLDFLTRCVASLEGLVDEIVAVDGAWELFEGGPASEPEQEEAIWFAARQAGIAPRVLIPHRVWESQVAKRARLMELASEHADWVLVIDGDEYVTYSEPETVRRELDDTDLLCAYVTFRNLNHGETMPGTTPQSGLNRRLFRSGTTVRTVHSGYFHGKRNVLVNEEALDLRTCLALEHDNVNRGFERNQRSRMYRQRRDMYAEKWVTV
jgi:hypothetical protein